VRDPWTAEERAALWALTAQPLPADPTNRWADDPAAALLGQKLYFDPRFSGPLALDDPGGLGLAGESGKVACVSCHDPATGGVDHRSKGNTSEAAGWTGRTSPTVLNAARSTWQFWDGRKDSLWAQATGPIEGAVEHNFSRLALVHQLDRIYRQDFVSVFGGLTDFSDLARFPSSGKPGEAAFDQMAAADQRAVNEVYSRFGKAIAAYERRLMDRSAFDRFMAGDTTALSDAAVRGAKLFVGRAACNECHSGPNLADSRFHNHAIPQDGPHIPAVDPGRANGIPAVVADVFNAAGPFSDQPTSAHLSALSTSDLDLGAFKTATLRNIGRTAPYMHTGGFPTLWDVMVWYRDAAGTDGFVGKRDIAVQPLLLSDDDMNDIIAFLQSLDGDALPAELVTKPVLP